MKLNIHNYNYCIMISAIFDSNLYRPLTARQWLKMNNINIIGHVNHISDDEFLYNLIIPKDKSFWSMVVKKKYIRGIWILYGYQ